MIETASEASEFKRLADALNNGRNTSENRVEALKVIIGGNCSDEDKKELIKGLEIGWRKAGEVVDSELDAEKLEKIPQI